MYLKRPLEVIRRLHSVSRTFYNRTRAGQTGFLYISSFSIPVCALFRRWLICKGVLLRVLVEIKVQLAFKNLWGSQTFAKLNLTNHRNVLMKGKELQSISLNEKSLLGESTRSKPQLVSEQKSVQPGYLQVGSKYCLGHPAIFYLVYFFFLLPLKWNRVSLLRS